MLEKTKSMIKGYMGILLDDHSMVFFIYLLATGYTAGVIAGLGALLEMNLWMLMHENLITLLSIGIVINLPFFIGYLRYSEKIHKPFPLAAMFLYICGGVYGVNLSLFFAGISILLLAGISGGIAKSAEFLGKGIERMQIAVKKPGILDEEKGGVLDSTE